MGTPDFARRPLEYLYKNTRHKVLAVVTGPDKPSGRGLKLVSTPVKSKAMELNLPVFTPESLKDDSFIEAMKIIPADIFVVVAFRILPEALFTIPPNGSINLHGSLLPKYRGAAPINWAIINGETETGLTTFFLRKKVDTGSVIFQEKIQIGPEETFSELYERMSELAGPVIERTLDLIESGKAETSHQDERLATPAPKITPFDCMIDWGFPSRNVVNFIRGMSSVPGAFTYMRGKKLKIFRAKAVIAEMGGKHRPGEVIKNKNRLTVVTADGAVEITELLPEGKSVMSGEQFLRGYRLGEEEVFGERPKGNLE